MVNAENGLHTFQFNYHTIFNDQIHLVTAVESHTLVNDREIDLSSKGQSPKLEFVTKAFLIGGFQESGTKMALHLNGSSDDLLGQGLSNEMLRSDNTRLCSSTRQPIPAFLRVSVSPW